ncbi:MAG: lipopolysaccharide biosynthesis protein [Janthinobacterium lividum]
MSPEVLDDPQLADSTLEHAPASAALPSDVAKHVVQGTSTLGAAVFVERGASFLANVLAARMAGASVFGAYSLGITTANNISTYAAGGIGTTATRFSGKYPYSGGNYRIFAQVMATISLLSAALAALALTLGAGPIARLLHKPDLIGLLQWAGITAAGMVLLECARGFFVGQRRLVALAALSILVGAAMLAVLPAMALTHRPAAMVISHGVITLTSVAVCCALAVRLRLMPPAGAVPTIGFLPLLREVWSYGLIQLSGLVSANLAGWWVTALVARGDPSLVQISFFSIASQLRNLIGLVPSLLTEGSFAVMASPGEDGDTVSRRVMALCTFAATSVSLLVAALTAIVAPLLLRLMYGRQYESAALVVSVAVGVAVIQMGNAPPSARLSVVSIRFTAILNTVWAVFTAAVGTFLMLKGGSAAGAMGIFMAAHILIAVMVLVVLQRRDRLPSGMIQLFAVSTMSIVLLAALALLRANRLDLQLQATGLMIAVTAIAAAWLYRLGKHNDWLPSREMLAALKQRFGGMTGKLFSRGRGGVA